MRKLHNLALVLLVLSFALVTLGGVVHNSGSSLACPDWPLCFGKVFPKMEGHVAIEHSHRLLASLVGILTVLLVLLATTVRHSDRKIFRLSLLALALVIFQGTLGGLTVLLRLSPILSTAHLATSQLFIGTLLYIWFQSRAELARNHMGFLMPLQVRRGLKIAAALTFLQMVVGAFVRHTGAGSSCGLGPESALFCTDPVSAVPTLWPQSAPALLHMLHRFLGMFTAIAVLVSTGRITAGFSSESSAKLRWLGRFAQLLVVTQIVLGVISVSSGLNPMVVTSHLVVAMGLWLTLLSQSFLLSSRVETVDFTASLTQIGESV